MTEETVTIPMEHYKRLIGLVAQLGTIAVGEAERYNNFATTALQTGHLNKRADFVKQANGAALIGNTCLNELVLSEQYVTMAEADEGAENVVL